MIRCCRLIALLLSLALVGCGEEPPPVAGPLELSVWFHTGQPGERRVIEEQVTRFNASQDEIAVALTLLPEGSYNAQVQAAALADALPDLLEFDGPFLYNYVWQGRLRPLDDLLPASLRDDLLPSIVAQGRYRDALYAVGSFDSGLGLWADRKALEAVGARIPSGVDDAWSVDEFEALLAELAKRDEDGAVLDLKLNYRGEWTTYAFSPLLVSAGADLVMREGVPRAAGVLDGKEAVAAMQRLQRWIGDGRVDPNLDDDAFTARRVALSWVGHWEYNRYREVLGDDLLLLPLPDFGHGARTGQGSWAWGVTRRCEHPEVAAAFLAFLLRPGEVLAMSEANGAVPATREAVARSPLYGEGGALRLFVEQLERGAVPRPRTPAYPAITNAFQQAFDDIRNGGDVQQALSRAAAVIDRDIADNRGYP